MSERLERLCLGLLIRLFGTVVFLTAPMDRVFAVCADIAETNAPVIPPPPPSSDAEHSAWVN